MVVVLRDRYPYPVTNDHPWKYRFSKREQLSRKCLFTHAYNPEKEGYEDHPLLIWEDDPSPPNDNEITEDYLHQP